MQTQEAVPEGLVKFSSIPVIQRGENKSQVLPNLKPYNQPPAADRLTLAKSSFKETEDMLLSLLSTGAISGNEPWFNTVKKMLEKAVHTSVAEKIISLHRVGDNDEAIFVSAEAAQLFLKRFWLRLFFLPKDVRKKFEAISKNKGWKEVFEGKKKSYTREQVRDLAFRLAEEASVLDEEAYAKRTEVHEMLHVTNETGFNQATIKLDQLAIAVIDYNSKIQLSPEESKVIRQVKRLEQEIDILEEAEAILHEFFSSLVLDPSDPEVVEHFSLPFFQFRAAHFLASSLGSASPKMSRMELQIENWQGHINNEAGVPHDAGFLILLFLGEVLSDKKGTFLDFSSLLEGESNKPFFHDHRQANEICGRIIERIEEVSENPAPFAKALIERDVRSIIIGKLNQKRIELGNVLIHAAKDMKYMFPMPNLPEKVESIRDVVKVMEEEQF